MAFKRKLVKKDRGNYGKKIYILKIEQTKMFSILSNAMGKLLEKDYSIKKFLLFKFAIAFELWLKSSKASFKAS